MNAICGRRTFRPGSDETGKGLLSKTNVKSADDRAYTEEWERLWEEADPDQRLKETSRPEATVVSGLSEAALGRNFCNG